MRAFPRASLEFARSAFTTAATTDSYTLSLHDALPISSLWTNAEKCSGNSPWTRRARSRMTKRYRRASYVTWHDRSEEHTSELQSHHDLVCRLLPEKKTPPVAPSRGPPRTASSSIQRPG